MKWYGMGYSMRWTSFPLTEFLEAGSGAKFPSLALAGVKTHWYVAADFVLKARRAAAPVAPAPPEPSKKKTSHRETPPGVCVKYDFNQGMTGTSALLKLSRKTPPAAEKKVRFVQNSKLRWTHSLVCVCVFILSQGGDGSLTMRHGKGVVDLSNHHRSTRARERPCA